MTYSFWDGITKIGSRTCLCLGRFKEHGVICRAWGELNTIISCSVSCCQIYYRLRRKCFAVSRFKVSISTAYSSKHVSHCKSGTLNFRSFLTCWRSTVAEVPGLAHPHGLDLFQDALLARSVLISRRHSQRRVVHSQEGNCRFQRF